MENGKLSINAWLKEAVKHHQNGDMEAAESLYKKILGKQPRHVETLFLLGSLNSERGNNEVASLLFKEAISLRPDHAEAHNNLSVVFLRQGRVEEAVEGFKRAASYKPDFVEAYFNLGIALQHLGRVEEAVLSFNKVVALKSDYVEAYNNLGDAFQRQGKLDNAVSSYKLAIKHRPNYADAHYNLGIAYQEMGNQAEAEACYKAAIECKPDYAEAHYNLGNLLKDQWRLEEASASYSQALACRPDYVEAYNNLGEALYKQRKPHEAVACYNQALMRRPDYPEARLNRAIAWLLMGNYEQGWLEYDQRLLIKKHRKTTLSQPKWDGSPLNGRTVLVQAEQGFGDTFQFVRLLPFVKAKDGNVVFECQQGLSPLLKRCPGIDQIIERTPDRKPLAQFDTHIPLMSLPGLFGIRLNTVPRDIPYIFPDAGLVLEWGDRLKAKINNLLSRDFSKWDRGQGAGCSCQERDLPPTRQLAVGRGGIGVHASLPSAPCSQPPHISPLSFPSSHLPFKVGLVWAGNPSQANDSNRSCSLSLFAPLGEVPGVLFFSLQKGAAAAQADNPPDGMPIINLEKELNNFSDTAAVIANLDLVITVDTAVAHLSGALGKPVWTILCFSHTWHYGMSGGRSPWYPTMRLFRQPEHGDWRSVIQCVAEELRKNMENETPMAFDHKGGRK